MLANTESVDRIYVEQYALAAALFLGLDRARLILFAVQPRLHQITNCNAFKLFLT